MAAFVILLSRCVKQSPTVAPEPGDQSAVMDGETLLEARSVTCHSLSKVTSKARSVAE